MLDAPVNEVVPAGHARHVAGVLAPIVAEYNPATHAMQLDFPTAVAAVE